MKRIIYGLVIIGLVWGSMTSCKKNNGEETVPENGFRATIVQPDKGNAKGERTHINPNWNTQAATSVFWTENDLIKVANQGGIGSALTFQLTEGKNTMNGTFYTGEQNDGFFVPDYVAIYPVANIKGVANTISGTTATFNIPSTQIRQDKSFGEGAMPMVACSSTQTLDFYNVFGGLCVPLAGGHPVDSIKLTSLDPNDKLWGVFTVDCTSTNPLPTHVSGGSNSLTLICNNVFVNAANPDFYFMVPPGTLESGFTITIYKGATAIYEESVDWTQNPVVGFIPRSVIMKINHKLSVIQVTTKSPTFITHSSAYTGGTTTGANPTEYGILYTRAKLLSSRTSYEDFMEDAMANLRVDNNNVVKINQNFTSSSTSRNFNTEAMTGLMWDSVYVVRAYATNSDGTVFYGEPIPFATRKDYANDYGGMIPFDFSISPTKKINFSMGNLQWSATGGGSTPTTHATAGGGTAPGTWRFAEYQFEFVGNASDGLVYTGGMYPSGNVGVKCNNALVDQNYSGWIDLFQWATSGYHDPNDPSNLYYEPWTVSRTAYYGNGTGNPVFRYNTYGIGPAFDLTTSLTGNYANYDWGVYNAISNGGNTPGRWYTMARVSDIEVDQPWAYLAWHRPASTVNGMPNVRYFRIAIDVRNSVYFGATIFLPDVYEWPSTYVNSYPLTVNTYDNNVNPSYPSSSNNSNNRRWTEAEWSLLEHKGAVIMPVTGLREGSVMGAMTVSHYHTSSATDAGQKYSFQPTSSTMYHGGVRFGAVAVRLVRDAELPQ